jgi:hypothetical protein
LLPPVDQALGRLRNVRDGEEREEEGWSEEAENADQDLVVVQECVVEEWKKWRLSKR